MFMSQMAALKSMDLLSDVNEFGEDNAQGPLSKLKSKGKRGPLKSPMSSHFSYG